MGTILSESRCSDADIVNAMVEWFGRHFVAPTDAVPSYGPSSPYAWGGPYRADQVLLERFRSSEKRLIDKAVQQIERYGPVAWAPSRFHIQEEFLSNEASENRRTGVDSQIATIERTEATIRASWGLVDRMLARAGTEALGFARQFKKELIGKLAKGVATIIMLTLVEHLFGISDKAIEWLKLFN